VKDARFYGATALGVCALSGAVWAFTYRARATVEYIDRWGHHFHASRVVHEQPWWSVPTAVALVILGAVGVSLLLLGRDGVSSVLKHLTTPSRRTVVDLWATPAIAGAAAVGGTKRILRSLRQRLAAPRFRLRH
jgi:hypothetical protein